MILTIMSGPDHAKGKENFGEGEVLKVFLHVCLYFAYKINNL